MRWAASGYACASRSSTAASGDVGLARRHEGTGLGTAIAKGLVESMGGQVGYAPNSPRGSVFWVEITLDVAYPVAAPVAALARSPTMARRRLQRNRNHEDETDPGPARFGAAGSYSVPRPGPGRRPRPSRDAAPGRQGGDRSQYAHR
ncbi:hypothetical protein G6F50_017050 [Rhizopus delemar]|uniref:histidine kinase n=1 Tax=Rhizopus delemar TaxID=936053 RepID=A0A9P6XR43_9FUNG|nr:hypothetical protein G6F50_017050 [Rhizopus delemar]